MSTDAPDAPGTENQPGAGAPATGRTEPGPPPPAANQQEGEDDLSSEHGREDGAAPARKAAPGTTRSAAEGPEGAVVVGRPSAPDGEVSST